MKNSSNTTSLKSVAFSSLCFLAFFGPCKRVEVRPPKPAPSTIAYLTVARPAAGSDSPHPAFQDKYGGQTVVFDLQDPKKPKLLGSYDDATIAAKYEETGPPFIQCLPAKPGDDAPLATGGPRGTAKLPGNYPGVGFSGSGAGGCGTWSVAVCNRILGETDRDKAVDQVEWNEIAREINQNPGGGSTSAARDAYYRDKGFCVETKRYTGSQADRQELGDKFVAEHCDVKMMFYTNNPTPPPALINGHVETVTGITALGIQTNSWGTDGYVNGGSSGGFSHSRFPVYTPAGTTVFVSYVCKCSVFDRLF